jgi:MoaA/NifB/PqqE/SkfB family radical SAM enzyme
LKFTGKPHRLEALSLEITHRCICRCSMCNIWKIPPDVTDLGLSEWLGLFSSPELRHLSELELTGGEPFLRNDFLRHNGDVFACPVLPVALGNIKGRALGELFRSPAADRFRKKVGGFTECSVCTEPGMERIAWPFEGFAFLGLLAGTGIKNGRRLAGHMGLDKYL